MVWSAGRGCALNANYPLTPHTGCCRSRSATRSPSSRLFSSTVASRAKQIQAGPGQEQSRRQRPSAGRWVAVCDVLISFMLMIMTQSPCRRCSPAHPQPRPSSSPPLRRSPRPSAAPAPGGGGRVSQDRGRAAPLQSYSDFRQVAEAGAGAGARWVVFIFTIFIRSVL